VVITLGANIQGFLQFRLVKHRITFDTFFPEAFGHFITALGFCAGNTWNNFL
jgi:hypothetical protein